MIRLKELPKAGVLFPAAPGGMTDRAADALHDKLRSLSLSARAYDRVLRVARTCADLKGRLDVTEEDVFAAASYRELDRGGDSFWA